MPTLHIANTCFEHSLQEGVGSLDEGLLLSPVTQQLQFLPFLYADSEDQVRIAGPYPDNWAPFPEMANAGSGPCERVEVWGWSQEVRDIDQKIPSMKAVRQANSKQFCFERAVPLPGARLIWNAEELEAWEGGVLKSCFGLSGRGHRFSKDLAFCERQWKRGLPVIGEPWVERVLDFSSQWNVGSSHQLLGVTEMEVSKKGEYFATHLDRKNPFMDEHLEQARILLDALSKIGYFGPCGIDAFVYLDQGTKKLHPICEVNARRTMAQAALRIRERHFEGQSLSFYYCKEHQGAPLLPSIRGCKRQLFVV